MDPTKIETKSLSSMDISSDNGRKKINLDPDSNNFSSVLMEPIIENSLNQIEVQKFGKF